MQYLRGCRPGEVPPSQMRHNPHSIRSIETFVLQVVRVVAKVTKQGRVITHTEAMFYREDGLLMARGSHSKFVEATGLWYWVLGLRPWAFAIALRRLRVNQRYTRIAYYCSGESVGTPLNTFVNFLVAPL
jgi:hypothetical protein